MVPRSEETRRKVLAATTDVIIERGVSNVTIEAVAARSGVAKTTIYRHWPEPASLILDTIRSHHEHVGAPDTGSLRGDLRVFFGYMGRSDLGGKFGMIMPSLVECAGRDPEMARLLDRIGEERERGLQRILDRARERGELHTDLDAEQLVGVIVGPIVFQKVVRRRPLTPEYVDACVDVVVSGLEALYRRS